jgi:hypothetical protein
MPALPRVALQAGAIRPGTPRRIPVVPAASDVLPGLSPQPIHLVLLTVEVPLASLLRDGRATEGIVDRVLLGYRRDGEGRGYRKHENASHAVLLS